MVESDFEFYREDSPSETLKAYLESHDNLYDKTRFAVTGRFLQRRLPLDSMRVLEVGCGGGLWSAFFAERAASLTCCDIRPHVLEAARLYVSQCAGAERSARVDWFAGDIADHSFSDEYDFVFLKDVIEHVNDDVGFMRNVHRLLKRDGRAYVATQNSRSLGYLVEGTYARIRGDRDWRGWDPTHVRFYNAGSLATLAGDSGFRVVNWHGMYHVPYRFLSRLFFKRVREHGSLHLIERLGGERWPFSTTGWAIGALLRKKAD